jgi:hypothetical protein
MSDHETEFSPMGSEATSDRTASYSSNGSDSGAFGEGGDRIESDGFRDDGTTFLAELARAMQSTAASEQARNVEGTEQRRQAHIDAIRAREALEAEDLRELAKEDVKGIDAWSDGEIKRIKLERERRIASRREQLQIRLEEHHSVVAREVENVEGAVSAYRADIDQFFNRLETETDPVEIARLAGTRPTFPVLDLIGPEEAAPISEYPPVMSQAQAVAAETAAAVEAVATYDQVTDEPTDAGDSSASNVQESEPAPEAELIGVMEAESVDATDAESSASPPETTWEDSEDVQAEASPEEEAPVIAVAAEVPAPEAQEVEPETQEDETAEEPVSVAAESRVVMPRSTGAGSWLRWPNSSGDRPDSNQ